MWWVASLSLLVAALPAGRPAELVYVAVGESVASPGGSRAGDPARIARRLEESGLRVRLVDLTVPNTTVRLVREEQLLRAVALRPTLVTIAVGTSDVVGTTPLRSFSRDLQIVTDLLHRTKARVMIANLPRAEQLRSGAGHVQRRRVDAFNWAIVRIARREGCTLVDLRSRFAGASWVDAVGTATADALAPTRAGGGGAERAFPSLSQLCRNCARARERSSVSPAAAMPSSS